MEKFFIDMKSKITYKKLGEELERHGWKAETMETEEFGIKRKSTVFRNPDTDLFIVLPRARLTQAVEPIHLLHVRNVLENSGFWESFARQTNTKTGREANDVVQTLAGIKGAR